MKSIVITTLIFLTALSLFSLTVRDIQYTEDSSGDSPYIDQTVTVSGIVTRVYGSDVFIQDTFGIYKWSGIQLFSIGSGIKEGDYITVTGLVIEYYNKTEIKEISEYTIHSSNNILPAPMNISTATLGESVPDTAKEPYEGVLVIVENVGVTSTQDRYGDWEIDDGSGECWVTESDYAEYSYTPAVGDSLIFLTGIVDYDYGEFKILPSGDKDILKSIDGSGGARINPKYCDNNELINFRLDVFPSVDSVYGVINFVRVRFDVDSLMDSVNIITSADSMIIVKDSLNDRITFDIYNANLIDTVSIYIEKLYFEGPDTFTVYTGLSPSYFAYINEFPIINIMPEIDIMDIAEVQETMDGYKSIYLNESVTIKGIVTGPSSIFSPTSSATGFYIQDETGGVNIYSGNDAMNSSFKLGMELLIIGTVEEYNGLTEVKYSSPETDIMIINDTLAIVEPKVLINSQGVNELNEGSLLKAQYGKVITAPVTLGSGKNFQILNGQTIIDVRADEKTDLFNSDLMNTIKPGMLVNVIGIGGQYDTEEPYSSGYQLLVRFMEDIELVENEEDSTLSVAVFPNPVSFERGETARIEIECLNNERITARIFDMNGRLIKVIAENVPGSTTIIWDGKNHAGAPVNIASYILVVEKITFGGKVIRIIKPIIVTTILN